MNKKLSPRVTDTDLNKGNLLQWRKQIVEEIETRQQLITNIDGLISVLEEGEENSPNQEAKRINRKKGIADATYRTLQTTGKPAHRSSLYDLVTAQGFAFGGKAPLNTFSIMLSKDKRFSPTEPRGTWMLTEWLDDNPPPHTRTVDSIIEEALTTK